MSDVVRITVKTHVKKYLVHHFGETLMIRDKNYASTLLRSLFEQFSKQEPWKVRPSQKISLGAMYDVCMGETGLRTFGGFLSDDSLRDFSKNIDLLIKQEMYRWCHHPNATDEVVDFNIRRFQDFYGFEEEELSFDNLKRWYYRERERLKKRHERAVSSSPQLIIPLYISEQESASEIVAISQNSSQTALFPV